MADLTPLIERVEAASEGSGQLSHEVLLAMGYDWNLDFGSSWYAKRGAKPSERIYAHKADVTRSLEAAMALAGPGEHLAFDVHFMPEEDVIRYRGYSFRPDWAKWNPHDMEWLNRDGSENPLCASPALAITAAALRLASLRALQHQETGHG